MKHSRASCKAVAFVKASFPRRTASASASACSGESDVLHLSHGTVSNSVVVSFIV